jgi:DNA primase large subunit
MNLEARKIEFVQGFLKLQSEEAVSRLEKLLQKEMNASDDLIFKPLTQDELDKRIDQSESDFRNKRYKSSSELLAKYE